MNLPDEQPSPLERALSRASREPAMLPGFYRRLLRSEVYLLGSRRPPEGDGQAQAVTLIQWETESGDRVIPVFTSLEAVRRSVDTDDQVLRMGVAQFLTLGTDVPLVLDPLSEHNAVLSTEDVRALAEGHLPGVGASLVQRGAVDRDLALIMPSPQPVWLIDQLTIFLSERPEVEAAWLCALETDGSEPVEEGQRLLIGLDLPTDVFEEVVEDIVCVIGQSAAIDEIDHVDVIAMTPGPLADHVRRQFEPFYRRSWGARLTDPLQIGHA